MIGEGTVLEEGFMKSLYSDKQLLGKPLRSKRTALSDVQYRKKQSRLIEKSSDAGDPYYRVKVSVIAEDRVGFLRDIGIELAGLGVNIYQIRVSSHRKESQAHVILTLEVMSFTQLRRAFDSIEAVDGVLEVKKMKEKAKQ